MIGAYNLIFDQRTERPFFDGDEITYGVPVRSGRPLSALSTDGTTSVPVHVLEIEPNGEKLAISELRRGWRGRLPREARDLLSGLKK